MRTHAPSPRSSTISSVRSCCAWDDRRSHPRLRRRELRPDAAAGAMALADALMHAGRTMMAREQADVAIALAEHEDMRVLASAHEMAARRARRQGSGVSDRVMPKRRTPRCHAAGAAVRARTAALRRGPPRGSRRAVHGRGSDTARARRDDGRSALVSGESLARLDRYPTRKAQFRDELQAYPATSRPTRVWRCSIAPAIAMRTSRMS